MPDTALEVQEPIAPNILDKITSYEDFLSLFVQLEENSTAYSWLKADLLLKMSKELGDDSLVKMAKDLRQKESTVRSYIRVSRAFPEDKREPSASFSAHYQASFADSSNDKEKIFVGENRFKWIQKAAEENLSTREIALGIQEEKTRALLDSGQNEQAVVQECKNKIKEINILLHNLLKAVKKGDTNAYDKVKNIYDKIYG